MKKLLKRIGIMFVVLFISIIGLALIDGSNDEELKSNHNQEISELESFLIKHDFNVEDTMAIVKECLPAEDYENITWVEEEGTAGAGLWCNSKLSYYLIFYSNEHPETPGELMSIDTAEEDYNNRTRLFQAY